MPDSTLENKMILAVDDEIDVLDALGEQLDMCQLVKKTSYEDALAYLKANRPDLVILDIMGVNGMALLEYCAGQGIPAVMLTAHAFSLEMLKRSMELGAKGFFPKEAIAQLTPFLEEILGKGPKDSWQRLFDRLGGFFNAAFGADWKQHVIEIGPFIVPDKGRR